MKYTNREQAGIMLARELKELHLPNDTMVLALPRGGVPVAYSVAYVNHWLLDVCIVRKIGLPQHPEYAVGAMASPNIVLLNEFELKHMHIPDSQIQQLINQEYQELERRLRLYRKDKPFPIVKNKTVVIVDDGIATGYTMKAAIKAIQSQQPKRLIVAVPVASLESIKEIEKMGIKVICPLTPYEFSAVGMWYDDFSQTTDYEVQEWLAKKTI